MSKRGEKRRIVESDGMKTWRTFFSTPLKETLRKEEILIPNAGPRGEIRFPCYLATDKEENTIEEIDEFITLLAYSERETKCRNKKSYEVSISLPVNNRWIISKFGMLRRWWKGITVNFYGMGGFFVYLNLEKDSSLLTHDEFSTEWKGVKERLIAAYINHLEPTCDIIVPNEINLAEHDRTSYTWGRRLTKTGNDFQYCRFLPFSTEPFYASVQIYSRDASYFKTFLVEKGIEFVVSDTNYRFDTIDGSRDGKAVQLAKNRDEKIQNKYCRQELIDISMCLQNFIHVYAILWVSDWISYLAHLQESWKVDVIRNVLKSMERLKEGGGNGFGTFKKKNRIQARSRGECNSTTQ